MTSIKNFAIGSALTVAASLTAGAAEVHLKDGSIIVGTIENLVDGEDLKVDTEHMDLVTIEWDAVEEIRGDSQLVLELFTGERIVGDIAMTGDKITVTSADDQQTVVAPDQVFAIEDVNDDFWAGLSAHTDLGANIVRGNNQVTQYSLGAGIEYDATDYETGLDGTSILNQQNEGTDTRRATLAGYYNHNLGNNWQAGGLYQFERDGQQQLEGRSLLAGVVGNRIINGRRNRVSLMAGLALNSEDFETTEPTESMEGLLGATYRLRSTWDLDIDSSLMVFPSLEGSDRTRVQFDSSLSFEILGNLDFKLTFYDRYDSEPPTENEKNDYGLTLGLSWEL